MEGVPVFKGKLEEQIPKIVKWVDLSVARTEWTNERISADYGKRSTARILADSDTCYMGPCADLSVVALECLKTAEGVDDTALVIERLVEPGFEFRRFHFAVEFSREGSTYFLDFNSMNRVIFGEKEYTNIKPGIERESLLRVNGDSIMPDRPLYVSTGIEFEMLVPLIERMKADNTPETRQKYLEARGPSESLYIEHLF